MDNSPRCKRCGSAAYGMVRGLCPDCIMFYVNLHYKLVTALEEVDSYQGTQISLVTKQKIAALLAKAKGE